MNQRDFSEPVSWQPISLLLLVADLIDGAVTDTRQQIETLTEARAKPHVFDDATVDRIERVFGDQLQFIEIYREQLRRWRTENPTAAQSRELDRLETQNSRLREMNTQVLGLAVEIRKGSIDRIMEKSDLELGLEALGRYQQER
jgi:transposase-like protein